MKNIKIFTDVVGYDGNGVGMGTYMDKGVVRSKPLSLKATTILAIGAKIMK